MGGIFIVSRLFPTISTDPKQHQGMPFDLEVGLVSNCDQFVIRNANIHIHHAMTFPAREMVVVLIAAGPVGVASIRKFDPVQQPFVNQHLDRPKNGGAAQARVEPLQVVPELLHAKILAAGGQFGQPGGNLVPGLCFPPSLIFEGGPDFFGYGCRITLSIHKLFSISYQN
jgi:hypothetical protein